MFGSKNRRTFICAANQEAEDAFKKTVEIDRLIDTLREANPREVRFILSNFHSGIVIQTRLIFLLIGFR